MVQREKLLVVLAFLGFVLGIVYVNLIAADYFVITGVFNNNNLKEFLDIELKMEEYLPMILWVRLAPIVFLVFTAYSSLRKIIVVLFCIWTGFLLGCFISLSILQLGIVGILVCILGVLPQMIFYLPAYLIVVLFAYRYPSSRMSVEKVCVILVCMLLGIILECKVNPTIMRWFINVI